MKVKVFCPCGAKFEFEVEPVNGRMPVSLNCPVCGADATQLANDVIQSQLGPAAAEMPAPQPAPARSGLRIAKTGPPHAPAPAHAAEAADESSPADDTPAHAPAPVPQRRNPAASPAWKKTLNEGELSPLAKYLSLAAVGLVAIAGALCFWYIFFAREPKVVYSLDLPKAGGNSENYRPEAFYQLLAPDRLLSIKNQNISLLDVTQGSPIWTAPFSGEDAFSQPHVVATTNDIWVAWPDKLLRLDRQSGKETPLAISDPAISVVAGDHMILVLSGNPRGTETLTQFSLPDGTSQSEDITAVPDTNQPLPGPITTRPVAPGTVEEASEGTGQSAVAAIGRAGLMIGRGNIGEGASITTEAGTPRGETAFNPYGGRTRPFFDAGPNAVWFQTRLLEHREITVQAMKKPPARSVLDSANVTASQGIDLAEEMANNSQREKTGGVDIVDVSRYQVTLHRLFAHDAPDWTGEITGPPAFVPLKTVDLIVAGTNLSVFDKSNNKLWDAKLTYPVSSAFGSADEHPPCLETGDALYFADKGMLTRFDTTSGTVRWRLTSVGISSVQADDRGRLYVDTTTLSPEAIQYSQQINLRERDLRVLMQVDPASGKILWHSDLAASYYHSLLSGPFLYSARVWHTQDALRLEEGPDVHFTLNWLKPADGKPSWDYELSGKQLVKAEVRQKWILLQFQDQVLVLKFFSL